MKLSISFLLLILFFPCIAQEVKIGIADIEMDYHVDSHKILLSDMSFEKTYSIYLKEIFNRKLEEVSVFSEQDEETMEYILISREMAEEIGNSEERKGHKGSNIEVFSFLEALNKSYYLKIYICNRTKTNIKGNYRSVDIDIEFEELINKEILKNKIENSELIRFMRSEMTSVRGNIAKGGGIIEDEEKKTFEVKTADDDAGEFSYEQQQDPSNTPIDNNPRVVIPPHEVNEILVKNIIGNFNANCVPMSNDAKPIKPYTHFLEPLIDGYYVRGGAYLIFDIKDVMNYIQAPGYIGRVKECLENKKNYTPEGKSVDSFECWKKNTSEGKGLSAYVKATAVHLEYADEYIDFIPKYEYLEPGDIEGKWISMKNSPLHKQYWFNNTVKEWERRKSALCDAIFQSLEYYYEKYVDYDSMTLEQKIKKINDLLNSGDIKNSSDIIKDMAKF